MRVLVFDTETTGLPKKRYAKISDSENWPHIIQLSYVVFDSETDTLTVEGDHIIKLSDDIEIPESSVKIHGITREISKTQGISITRAIGYFMVAYANSDVVVAHNTQFDKDMINAECYRNKIKLGFQIKPVMSFMDTMKMGKDICNIRMQHKLTGEIYVKPPKLTELYQKLFDVDAKNLHNSFIDVLVCLRCYAKLSTLIDRDIYDTCPQLKILLDEYVN